MNRCKVVIDSLQHPRSVQRESNGGSFNLTRDSISLPLIVRSLIESDTRSWDSATKRTRKTCLPLARLPACSRGYVCLHNMATIFVNHRTDKNARPDALDNCYRRVRADLLSIVSRFLFPARISRSRRLVSTIPFFFPLFFFLLLSRPPIRRSCLSFAFAFALTLINR